MTTLRCARCKRPLSTATIQISGCAYGPKCADRMGLSTDKPKKKRQYAHVFGRWVSRLIDPNQLILDLTQ
mgnify:CR=1 FL=1